MKSYATKYSHIEPLEPQSLRAVHTMRVHVRIPTMMGACVNECVRCKAEIPRQQFLRSIMTSSPTRPTLATFPFSLPRAYLIGRPAVCCVVYCCPFVRVLCRSPNSTSPTRTTCCGHPREYVTRMLRGNCFRGI